MKLRRNNQEQIAEEDLDNDDEFMGEDDNDDFDDSLFEDEDLTNDFFGDGGRPPMEKHKDLLKDLTNFDPFIKDTFNNWLGLVWDEEKEDYVRNPALKPVLSVQGAAWCSGVLKTYTRGNNIITDIGSEEYKIIMNDLIENVWLNLGTREELGIKTDGDLIRVCNEIEHSAALVLMGAGDGKYNKFLGTTYSAHFNGNPNNGLNNNNPNMIQMPKKQNVVDKIKNLVLGG